MAKTHLEYLPGESNVGELSLFIFIQPTNISSAKNLSRWDAQRVGRAITRSADCSLETVFLRSDSPLKCVYECVCYSIHTSRHIYVFIQFITFQMAGEAAIIYIKAVTISNKTQI